MLTTLLLLATAAAAGLYFYRRQRGSDAGAMPAPARAAARRLGYVCAPDRTPIGMINSPELCISAMAAAFARMDTVQQIPDDRLAAFVQKRLGTSTQEATDMISLAPWLVAQGGGASPAFQQLTKRLKQLDHGADFDKLMRVLGDVTAAGTKGMPSPPQADALGALARVFRTA